MLKVRQDIFVWIHDTFDNNFEIKNNPTNYLKETCR